MLTHGFGQLRVLIGAQIPEKLPAVSNFPNLFQVEICDNDFILVFAALDQNLTAGVHEIAGPVKFAELPGFFQADAVIGADENAIGNRLGRLFKLP